MILHKISRFFWTGLLCFSSKSLHPESVTAATFTLPKNWRSAYSTWMLIGLPDFSCFKFFIFQCFKPVTSCVVQEWDPPTTAITRWNWNANKFKLQHLKMYVYFDAYLQLCICCVQCYFALFLRFVLMKQILVQ